MIIKKRINKISLYTAVISFLIGSMLLLMYLYTGNYLFEKIGIIYVKFATGINMILLCVLIYNAFAYPQSRKETLSTLAIVLLNIPIALLYILIAFVKSFSNWPD